MFNKRKKTGLMISVVQNTFIMNTYTKTFNNMNYIINSSKE